MACEALLGEALDEGTLREALAGVRWPGRLEVVGRQPAIVLDGAHNPAGAEALADALRESSLWERLHLVLAISANKDVAGIVAPLAPLADVAYAARNESERTGDATPIAEAFGVEGAPVTVHGSVAEALDAAGQPRARRSHLRDGLSVHCRGRPPGARPDHLSHRAGRPCPARSRGDRRSTWRPNPPC